MKQARLDKILSQAAGKRIVVIGDLMLDEFVWGKVGRISPEAPVPVVEWRTQTEVPGGAANNAQRANLQSIEYAFLTNQLTR